jgi:iron complex outermembrane receptor protein
MNKIFILVLINFIFSIHHSFAQTHIIGKLLNNDKEAIPFATVALLKAKDSSIVKGTYTDGDGKFEFEKTPIGKYLVKSMVVGMQSTFSQSFDIITDQNRVLI